MDTQTPELAKAASNRVANRSCVLYLVITGLITIVVMLTAVVLYLVFVQNGCHDNTITHSERAGAAGQRSDTYEEVTMLEKLMN